eukprot:762500-Amphidinium_carterae.1
MSGNEASLLPIILTCVWQLICPSLNTLQIEAGKFLRSTRKEAFRNARKMGYQDHAQKEWRLRLKSLG